MEWRISASAIAALKACPMRFCLGYVERIRVEEDTDATRIGSHWHELHEIKHAEGDDAALQKLAEWYAEAPDHKTLEDWTVEYYVLLTAFMAYYWYWENDAYEVLASEIRFDQPMLNPNVRLPLPMSDVKRVGFIDHVVRYRGIVGNLERKSTSVSIEPDAPYWERWLKDTQVSMYALAFRHMQEEGLDKYGIALQDGDIFGNTIVDVWRKPAIRPKKLTQAETKRLIENGTYFEEEFDVEAGPDADGTITIAVDGWEAEVTVGAKGDVAIRETPALYAARLLADMQHRPEYYFARREVARTDRDIERFETSVYNIYSFARAMDSSDCWYENEFACRDPFPCAYIPICYGPGADAVRSGEAEIPKGFTQLTVKETP
jgi:hypothetical protein